MESNFTLKTRESSRHFDFRSKVKAPRSVDLFTPDKQTSIVKTTKQGFVETERIELESSRLKWSCDLLKSESLNEAFSFFDGLLIKQWRGTPLVKSSLRRNYHKNKIRISQLAEKIIATVYLQWDFESLAAGLCS